MGPFEPSSDGDVRCSGLMAINPISKHNPALTTILQLSDTQSNA